VGEEVVVDRVGWASVTRIRPQWGIMVQRQCRTMGASILVIAEEVEVVVVLPSIAMLQFLPLLENWIEATL